MKNCIGESTNGLKEYYDNQINKISIEELEVLKELVHEVSLYETIEFINNMQSNKIYFNEDIQDMFDFKYQFVIRKINNRPMALSIDVNKELLSMFRQISKGKVGSVIKSDKQADDYLRKPRQEIIITKEIKEVCGKIAMRKNITTKKRLMEFVKEYFRLSVNDKVLQLNDDGVRGVVDEKWKSAKNIMDNSDIKHENQLYRMLKKKDVYYKIIYLQSEESKSNVTRYLKI